MSATDLISRVGSWLAAAAAAAGLITTALARAGDDWRPVPGHIMTRWAAEVSPDNALPEYPRPMMVRERWLNLNGLWGYAIGAKDGHVPDAFAGRILVPYPIESALSGVGRPLEPSERLWYRRNVEIPADWKGQRVLIHFGAVDWQTEVLINGASVGRHTGGYDPFSFDITDQLRDGSQEITVAVADPTDTGGQPRGKQVIKPGGIFYTRVSGIWQTVWLEPVPKVSIAFLRFEPDVPGSRLNLKVGRSGDGSSTAIDAEAIMDGKVVSTVRGKAGDSISLPVPDARLWTPDDPFLYDLRITLLVDGTPADSVMSYFGMREVKLGPDAAGIKRILLNGKPDFMFGPLDQGFWPDGIYTAPTDAALRSDVEAVKRMGGNMLRKHVKVEPQRFYQWCDRLGVLVWQDMPSGDNAAPARPEFESELGRMMDALHDHPSIVMWVPFNEGWGQYDTERVVGAVKQRDPSRLVNNASGWTDKGAGDVIDIHSYPGPGMAAPEHHRASVLGEFGGLGLPVKDHLWIDKGSWGYVSYKDTGALTDAYVSLIKKLRPLAAQGLCAAVYTQTTDCEIEVNGWMTYDRAMFKIDPERAAAAAKELHGPLPTVRLAVPTAREQKSTWRYTFDRPGEGWEKPGFDDAKWQSGPGGFGTAGTPGAVIGTTWDGPDIWIRRTIEIPAPGLKGPNLLIHHDEDAEVYIGGELVAKLAGYTSSYTLEPLGKAIGQGPTTMAIHCHQTSGGQFIDAGLADLIEPAPEPRHERHSDYEPRRIRGFDVRINRELAARDPALLERVLLHLEADLDDIESMIPAPAMAELRQVTLWVEFRGTSATVAKGRGLCCHWSTDWLRSQGMLADKVGGVEIINPQDFLAWRHDQPYMLLHELAHAYQWRLGGLDGEIDAAYRAAMDAHLYDAVPRNSAPGGGTVKAYAATNSHEYFAEFSEAYFALNDFFPFTRAQLAAHDAQGLKLIEHAWRMSADQIASVRAPREGTPNAGHAPAAAPGAVGITYPSP